MAGRCHPQEIRHAAFEYYARLARLLRYCEAHYAEPLSLERAARVVGLEPTYFSSYFHDKVGVCYTCWIAHLRVVHAQALFRERHRPIRAAGEAVGFGSLSSFERAFKRSTGMTASAYRARVRPA